MTHVRTQIRRAAVNALEGIDATVYASRVLPLEEAELPALLVYTNAEQIETEGVGSLDRMLDLVVDAKAQSTDIDTDLDNLVADVESAIAADPTLGGLVIDCLPASVEISISAEGAQLTGVARISFVARYRTTAIDPETAI